MAKIHQKFSERVYQVVKKIPRGRVVTYGQIASKLKVESGKWKIGARMVGWALSANRDSKVPCHRVVDRNGRLAPNFAFNGWREQRRRLILEKVPFIDDNHVDLEKCFWEK